jgi:hypothetical protein
LAFRKKKKKKVYAEAALVLSIVVYKIYTSVNGLGKGLCQGLKKKPFDLC